MKTILITLAINTLIGILAVIFLYRINYWKGNSTGKGANFMANYIKALKVRKYEVNCKPNDSIDIKCGGPPILGFDFYVDEEEPAEEIITFIKKELKKKGLPLMSIITKEKQLTLKGWTRKTIAKCIKNDQNVK